MFNFAPVCDFTMKEFIIESPDSIEKCAAQFLDYISQSKEIESNILAFYGAMGAGKTTFIAALCKVLGVKDVVNSPTFTIVNEYLSQKGFPVYHFDFYRIDSIKEAYDIGIEEYFAANALCLIEWPEKIGELLPEGYVPVTIEICRDGRRKVRVCR